MRTPKSTYLLIPSVLISFLAFTQNNSDSVKTAVGNIKLPKPFETKSANNQSKVVGWSKGETPKAPEGFSVTKFADGLDKGRWTYILPNGDVLISQANKNGSPDKISLLRDENKDGIAEVKKDFLTEMNKPFGMLLLNNTFYVACTDGVWSFPYKLGETLKKDQGKKILDLPAGGYNNHWTRNIIANHNQTKLLVSVGSASNVAEYGFDTENRRACILEVNLDGTGERIFASGLRNPIGMDYVPGTTTLWTAVNERDLLGDDLVPDYMTSVQEGGFYGWPYSYFGKNLDPRISAKDQRLDLVERSIVPDIPLGAHTAALGLIFYTKDNFPSKYKNGAFVALHGSWNRKELDGYKVLFVPFENGKPSGPPQDFLTGFIKDASKSQVHGRPVGVSVTYDGSLLVTDDSNGIIWKVSAKK